MTKVSGIDFTEMARLRNSVTVRMPDETVQELPLITLRDMPVATTFLRENDMLATKYGIVLNKINQRIEAIEAAGEEEQSDVLTDEGANVLSEASDSMIEMQREMRGLHMQFDTLCVEIRSFIRKYFSDDAVVKCLDAADNSFTIKVLQLMCYGDEIAKDATSAEEPENPTETPSQSN